VIFEQLVPGELVFYGEGYPACFHGIRAENREILHDETQLRIRLHKAANIREGSFAITAIIIEELDQRDITVRIACYDRMRSVEESIL
jgi:hypothetical protein